MKKLIIALLVALPLPAVADKFELRYKTSSSSTSVYIEYNEQPGASSHAQTAEDMACNLGALYASRGATQGVRVWRLTPDSTQASMTRVGGPICRFIEQGVPEN